MLRVIGNDINVPRQTREIASGTLPSGKPVVVNSDGTVSVISETSVSQATGSTTVYHNDNSFYNAAVYDSNAQKVVVGYADGGDSNKGKAVVGTISGTSITFGTPVLFEEGPPYYLQGVYDENAQKIVFLYRDQGNNLYGTGIVGTVSGTSISFGSAEVFNSGRSDWISAAYDSSNGKVVVAYKDNSNSNQGTAVVGTVSGTSISFGSEVIFAASGSTVHTSTVYDTNAQKIVICYEFTSSGGATDGGMASVGTVSGSSISFGTAVQFDSSAVEYIKAVYDENAQKVAIFYQDEGNSDHGTAIVGTVSGTSMTFGSTAVFDNTVVKFITAAYHADAKNITLTWHDNTNTQRELVVATISGTSITFGSVVVLDTDFTDQADSVYDPNNKVVMTVYRDYDGYSYGQAGFGYGTAIIFQTGYSSTNLTSENYIGMSKGTSFQAGSAASVGTSATFNSATTRYNAAAYDSNAQKVVIAYRDGGNSNKGNCVVGTVDPSDNSITYGSETNFNNATTSYTRIVYDQNAQKVVICYRDEGNNNYGTAIVGTVSGTSISFGAAQVFSSATTSEMEVTYDSDAQKIVVIYADSSDSGKGKARVGTISGTSISFGTATQFSSNNYQDYIGATYDQNAQKVVIACRDTSNSNYGTAVVGTVSGTSISFGSTVVYNQGISEDNKPVYDPSSQKVVIFYRDGGNSDYGTAIVGTVSGTSITFGAAVVFNEANTDTQRSAVYDSSTQKVVTAYRDAGDSYANSYTISGKVSGTSITFDSEVSFHSGRGQEIGLAYDSGNERVVIAYRDVTNSNHGKAVVATTNSIATTRGEVPDGGHVLVDTQGLISDNQIGLTAGQSYFVQTNGTLSTTADDPSVFAGTAVSATKLIVKG